MEMVSLFFILLGPVGAGIALALLWWLIGAFRRRFAGVALSRHSLVAGLTLVIGGVGSRLLSGALPLVLDVPRPLQDWHADYRFAVPLCLGILGLALLGLPGRTQSVRGAADLKPRTALSFVRGWWFVTPAAALALILTLTLAAGAASEPDDQTGLYTTYQVDLGGGRAMGTSIYGWFFSVPALISLGIMLVVATLALFLIARPALDLDKEQDVYVRTVRSRNVILIGTGALFVHLGLVFGSLAGTASMRSTFSIEDGALAFWTTFAALQPALAVLSSVTAALGFALWTVVALSGVAPRPRVLIASAR
jgi:hypothetical protein